ncbi:DUF58 domain-containing protein [Nodosilinea sp. LEGE 07088]|uniref:DUF58 domain-containing protein n=1 Tax=Nodosilinea sp. LEGE 07088 TaxID=2777968 RepID=UPI001880C24A|nr:DUF58 domain-containing protein [Nodosilinea sp. LEGE 07088]MBE9138275.1 DUF58 domain-containing protein [Nodosilinea sp. LEGE 07088]
MKRFTQWLERRWVNPAYGGWLLLGLAVFFFAAATNTLAGWLYVMSGVMLALLTVAALLPPRNLKGLVVTRSPLQPVTAEIPLAVELHIRNSQRQAKGLFQVIDALPPDLGSLQMAAVGHLAPGQTYTWRYQVQTTRRGIYPWQAVDLRTAAPLGLFWCRRSIALATVAVVYPQVLPLKRCPLLDTVGARQGQHWRHNPQAKTDTQGVTRSLRPYRWGDPTRLIHWRTSARYGELRVRELETTTASREIMVALNTSARWDSDSFEQAVIAAASLYTYALKQGFAATLWLPQEELLRETSQVMYALAAVNPAATSDRTAIPPQVATILLTTAGAQTVALPEGSRQILWGSGATTRDTTLATLAIDSNQALEAQLQSNLT